MHDTPTTPLPGSWLTSRLGVNPREIEELLSTAPGIREAVVVGVPDERRGEVPVAYIVADSECRIVFAEDASQLDKLKQHRSELPHLDRVVLFEGAGDGDWVMSLEDLSSLGEKHLAETGEFVHRNQRKILRRCDLTWVGETLVRGSLLTPASAVKAWMHSPEHRAVIMKPRANRAGVGVRLGGGQVYAVLNFGDIN